MDFFIAKPERPAINETARPLNRLNQPQAPTVTVWQLMKQQANQRDQGREALRNLLRGLAPVLFDLRRLAEGKTGNQTAAAPGAPELMQGLRLVWEAAVDALNRQGCGLEVLDGRPWAEVSSAEADLLQYIPDARLTHQVVLETVAPLVRHQGRIIQRAKVVVAGPPTDSLEERKIS